MECVLIDAQLDTMKKMENAYLAQFIAKSAVAIKNAMSVKTEDILSTPSANLIARKATTLTVKNVNPAHLIALIAKMKMIVMSALKDYTCQAVNVYPHVLIALILISLLTNVYLVVAVAKNVLTKITATTAEV